MEKFDSAVILVTGANGFIGTYASLLLAREGARVIGFDTASPRPDIQWLLKDVSKAVSLVRGDIMDLPSLMHAVARNKVTHIFHAAALFDPLYSLDAIYQTFMVNLVGSLNVFEAARLFGVQRVVISSTLGVCSDKRYEPMDEDHPIFLKDRGNPIGPYGSSKAAGELAALSYFTNAGVNTVVLRYSAVYGFGMRYPMYIKPMVESAVLGKPYQAESGGDMKRDYTHVKDVAAAVASALAVDIDNLSDQKVFNLSGGRLYSASEVAAVVREVIPGSDIQIGPGLTAYEKEDMALRGEISISAARRVLGFEPHYNLADGVRDFAETYRTFISRRGST